MSEQPQPESGGQLSPEEARAVIKAIEDVERDEAAAQESSHSE